MAMTNMAQVGRRRVAVGVDTHLDNHVAAVKDELGRDLGDRSFPATSAGYGDLLAFAKGFGDVVAFGVEGTGSYGAGLARFLSRAGELVIEVCRPSRQDRYRFGKSDPADARSAARAVLSGEASAVPKAADSRVEMIRMIHTAKSSAVRARTQALNVLKAAVVTAPAQLREELEGLDLSVLVRRAAALRPGDLATPLAAAKHAIQALARRYRELGAEITAHTAALERLTSTTAPRLLHTFGIGPDCAAVLLVAAGDNPGRMRSEAAFSMLCGASPVDASSGRQVRHRLNRGGNRQANAALHRIVCVRMRWHEPTRAYVARRLSEGKTKKEAMRCLKRYVAREVYNILVEPAPALATRDSCPT